MEMDEVENIYIQPVAHDGGLALGGGMIDQRPSSVDRIDTVYWGDSFENSEIKELLEANKIGYEQPSDLTALVAREIADGALVGWFQGRMELGPRALGNRGILADPRTTESLDRVNEYVKHREKWRPFAPSMQEDTLDTYLVHGEPAPFMIKTFETDEETRSDIEATIHQADSTTRPQTVNPEQNPRYYDLLAEFEAITGVPVLLNTSFNDHGEPIVRTPRQAIQDFYAMGLDVLVLEDFVITK
jgi:carbamoyltransferase